MDISYVKTFIDSGCTGVRDFNEKFVKEWCESPESGKSECFYRVMDALFNEKKMWFSGWNILSVYESTYVEMFSGCGVPPYTLFCKLSALRNGSTSLDDIKDFTGAACGCEISISLMFHTCRYAMEVILDKQVHRDSEPHLDLLKGLMDNLATYRASTRKITYIPEFLRWRAR